MDVRLAPEDEAFRDEVRRFLDERFTPDLRAASARQAGVFAGPEVSRAWHRILYDRGWIAPAWPAEHGGAGFSPVQRYLMESEFAAAGTPVLPAMGLQMCGPVLIGHGTPEQRARHLPAILSGDAYWCQGYSEPGAGSDLASLQCRAVRDGDSYVVDGTKIWTTHAQYADWMFLLVRTSTEGRPQAGISFLLLDMATPGLTVKPILSLSGEHEVNQCFFDGVRVPVANRVGAENDGWKVAKHLLQFERGGGFQGARLRTALGKIRHIVCEAFASDEASAFRRRLAELEAEVEGMAFSELRVISGLSTGAPVNDATASMIKLKASETMQKVTELALEALGVFAPADQRDALGAGANAAPIGPDWGLTATARYLNSRAASIYGGSSEVQRNILARTALGL